MLRRASQVTFVKKIYIKYYFIRETVVEWVYCRNTCKSDVTARLIHFFSAFHWSAKLMLSKKVFFFTSKGLLRQCTLGEWAVFCWRVLRLNKQINTALCFYINILPWLNLLHFHRLVSFVEDRNAAIIIFHSSKGVVSQLKVVCIYRAAIGEYQYQNKTFFRYSLFSWKWLRTYFFENSPGIFMVFTLPLKIQGKIKLDS